MTERKPYLAHPDRGQAADVGLHEERHFRDQPIPVLLGHGDGSRVCGGRGDVYVLGQKLTTRTRRLSLMNVR